MLIGVIIEIMSHDIPSNSAFGPGDQTEKKMFNMIDHTDILIEHAELNMEPVAETSTYCFTKVELADLILPASIDEIVNQYGSSVENVTVRTVASPNQSRVSLSIDIDLRDRKGGQYTLSSTTEADSTIPGPTEFTSDDQPHREIPLEISAAEMRLFVASLIYDKTLIDANRARFGQADIQSMDTTPHLSTSLRTAASGSTSQKVYPFKTPRQESLVVEVDYIAVKSGSTEKMSTDEQKTIQVSLEREDGSVIITLVTESPDDEYAPVFVFMKYTSLSEPGTELNPSSPDAYELMGAIRATALRTPKGEPLAISEETLEQMLGPGENTVEVALDKGSDDYPISADQLRSIVFGPDKTA